MIDDKDERIQQLEAEVEDLNKEVQDLKDQLNQKEPGKLLVSASTSALHLSQHPVIEQPESCMSHHEELAQSFEVSAFLSMNTCNNNNFLIMNV